MGVGPQEEEEGKVARADWLTSCTFLAARGSLWMRESQEAAGRVVFFPAYVFVKCEQQSHALLDFKPES